MNVWIQKVLLNLLDPGGNLYNLFIIDLLFVNNFFIINSM